jgi:hypothetical protein
MEGLCAVLPTLRAFLSVDTIYMVDVKAISETVQCNVCHVCGSDVNLCQGWYRMSSVSLL